ncbi:MAG: hypothetical protein ACK4UO_05150 [Pseudolabrys sp.]
MPIDLAAVDWIYVGVLSVFAFLAALVGSLVAFNHRGVGAVLAAILFAAMFVAWTYYPHGLPLPTAMSGPAPAATAAPPAPVPAPATPAAPQRPSNPIRDITPPGPAR